MADECRRVETMAVEPSMQPVSRMQKVCLFFFPMSSKNSNQEKKITENSRANVN